MIPRLVARSLARKPGRSLLLLVGYALGVGVTLTLLSIGAALLESSRDRALVGGGDLTVLPEGLDLETFRTGGVSSLHFTIDQAPFLYRQVLAGPRFAGTVSAAAPWMEGQLVYLEHGGERRAVSADGVLPSRSRALGVPPRVVEGRWSDLEADRRWTAPSDSALYAGIDAFHEPPPAASGDSTWAEWHYFNVALPEEEGWLYLTYMVAGEVPDGRWGGRMLATLVERTGSPAAGRGDPGSWRVRTYRTDVPARRVSYSTGRPDLEVGVSSVALDGAGRYRLRAAVPSAGDTLRLELTLDPGSRRYLPPLEVAGGAFPSGYVAPVLRGRAAGRICAAGGCRRLEGARAYHDHNWGVWRDVTWDWGEADAGPWSLVYGGVRRGAAGGSRFLFLTDSLGFAGLLPVRRIEAPSGPAAGRGEAGRPGARAPDALRVLAGRGGDSVAVRVEVRQARSSTREGGAAGASRGSGPGAELFHQMFGVVRLEGVLRGVPLDAAGRGFFETWTRAGPDRPSGDG